MSKIDNNKEQKRNSLLDSAFTLFLDNGFNKTSISDIVEKAGVAKGTFYLYFKDKYDIRNQLISHKANQVFQAACNELMKHKELKDFEEQVLFIIDNILDTVCPESSSGHVAFQTFKLGIFHRFPRCRSQR